MNNRIPNRGYLLHITHYDPTWCENKANEQPFDLDVAFDVIKHLAQAGGNYLIIDCGDGIVYDTHQELTRHYSQSKSILQRLVAAAREENLEPVPLLNFGQSGVWQNNHWFRPHNLETFDDDAYWKAAFEVIDEILGVVSPQNYFHIGMDEDHWRSYGQYVRAIERLHHGLTERNLRTMIWNCSCLGSARYEVFKDKSLLAEEHLPTDIVQIPYAITDENDLARIKLKGFELWGCHAGVDPQRMKNLCGWLAQNSAEGILLANWIPCIQENRELLIETINQFSLI